MATIKHTATTVTLADHLKHLLGTATSTAVTVTAKSTTAVPFLVTTKTQSSNFLVQTFTYSYDGVIHVDSYVSDI